MEKSIKKYTKIEMTNYTKYPDNVSLIVLLFLQKYVKIRVQSEIE